MADALKHFFDRGIVTRIAEQIRAAHPSYAVEAFTRAALRGIEALELIPRARHIALAMHKHLPPDFAEAARILEASLGPRMENTEGKGLAPFLYLPAGFRRHAAAPALGAAFARFKTIRPPCSSCWNGSRMIRRCTCAVPWQII